jgi:serine/threonine protein kinase
VLEYIDGKPLSQVIKEAGPMAAADAARFGIRMCEMLAVLHDLKPPMVHRDFTPDNLMLKNDSTLMLIDFAVAVAAEGEAEDTAGKASYMAPEQFKGKPTHQSDIYSLGGTLYYILTGQQPGPLQESNPIFENDSIPLTLSNLVAKCTKPNPSDRPANVHALKSELSGVAKSCGDK